MAKMDYNSSTFKNASIDKLKGKFGQQTQRSLSASSSTLANPFQQKTPLSAGLGDTSIKRPTAPKVPMAKPVEKAPETKPTAMASENKPAAAAPAAKTPKQVRKENTVAKLEAKGKSTVSKIESRGKKTVEDKMALREKRATNFGKAVKGAAELVTLGAGTYLTAYNAGKKKE